MSSSNLLRFSKHERNPFHYPIERIAETNFNVPRPLPFSLDFHSMLINVQDYNKMEIKFSWDPWLFVPCQISRSNAFLFWILNNTPLLILSVFLANLLIRTQEQISYFSFGTSDLVANPGTDLCDFENQELIRKTVCVFWRIGNQKTKFRKKCTSFMWSHLYILFIVCLVKGNVD